MASANVSKLFHQFGLVATLASALTSWFIWLKPSILGIYLLRKENHRSKVQPALPSQLGKKQLHENFHPA